MASPPRNSNQPHAMPSTKSALNANTNSGIPRKRRRRAPAAGAADDCFTCASAKIKCDRKRPYCSQCLDAGKDCGGYKTQLTWGVGVASRGKLRGLSLPIAGTSERASAAGQQSPPKSKDGSPTRSESSSGLDTSSRPIVSSTNRHSPPSIEYGYQSSLGSTRMSSRHLSISSTGGSKLRSGGLANASMSPASHQIEMPTYMSLPAHFSPRTEVHDSALTSSHISTPSARSGSSPDPFALNPALADNFTGLVHQQYQYIPNVPNHPTYPATFPELQGGMTTTGFEISEDQNMFYNQYPYGSGQSGYANTTPLQPYTFTKTSADGDFEPATQLDKIHLGNSTIASMPAQILQHLALRPSLPMAPLGTYASIGQTARMRYLIHYYAEVISPVIVAFDTPTNPYRNYILSLAEGNETLQHAISALAASNIRQRQHSGVLSDGRTDPARRSSIAHVKLISDMKYVGTSAQERLPEEVFHKQRAVQALNGQLADPTRRKDDSILATLLILCLFHMCDSGIAQLGTHFAGVKKLLSIRKSDNLISSKESEWLTRMFTWFDALSASVHNREGLLHMCFLTGQSAFDDQWALEHLVGCDESLFKVVSRLGRLNLLSQGKGVMDSGLFTCRSTTATTGISASDHDIHENNQSQQRDGRDPYGDVPSTQPPQTQFWQEWEEIHYALRTWQMRLVDPTMSHASATALQPDQLQDLSNISNAFRYAALLYCERLVRPSVAASDVNIQFWVRQALHYIQLVRSDVYLLWVLFITGSECVTDRDRDVIRQRCLSIQKDSGFVNNRICLELLERIWMKSPTIDFEILNTTHVSRQQEEESPGFKFASVMKATGDGEYIVI